MRILHVVTLVTPEGAFGGPVRVAVNHVRELRRQGHEAVLVAACQGYDEPPTMVEDVPAVLFPARRVAPLGFSGLTAPGMGAWMRRTLPQTDYVHVHLARDLITLPAADLVRRQGVPYVVQPHGMVDPSSNPLAHLLDSLLTRRVLAEARAVFHLTPREHDDLLAVTSRPPRLVELLNGTPIPTHVPLPEALDVLYMARLHPRKRPTLFVKAAATLLDEGADATFSIVGPDEGELTSVLAAIAASGHEDRIVYEGPLAPEHTAARLDRASVLVLPSVDEPFPMGVLEALAHGRPVLVTDSCGLAPLVRRHEIGIVTAEHPDAVTAGLRHLVTAGPALHTLARRARRVAEEELDMTPIARRAMSCASSTI